jgi:phosphate/sulfate permease/DNA-binding CsgD family transcriptional regulator
MVLLLISAGLLIGVIIGYRDVSVLYEAVRRNSSEKSYLSLIIIAFAILLGVVINKDGTPVFIEELARVSNLKTGAIILFSALIVAVIMQRNFKIVSISHAVIGSIIGWLLFIGYEFPLDQVLYIIVVWLLSPIMSFFIASWIYSFSGRVIRTSHIQIFKMDLIFQRLTFFAMIIAAYSLGANNSANITGVYIQSLTDLNVNILNWEISADLVLFVLAAISIIAGFFVSQLISGKKEKKLIFELSTEANFSVMIAYAIVFFLFSSRSFQEFLHLLGFSGYDLIPISTFHVLTAGLVGISYKKGFSIYNKDAMIKLPVKSLLTPLIAGLLTFIILVLIKVIFGDNTFLPAQHNPISDSLSGTSLKSNGGTIFSINDWNVAYNIVVISVFVLFIMSGYFIYSRMQKRLTKEKKFMKKQSSVLETEKEFFIEELKYAHKTRDRLKQEVDLKTAELEKFALQLVEKEKMLISLKNVIKLLKQASNENEREEAIREISLMINNSLNLAKERELFYSSISNVNADFFTKLSQQFSNLTENDQRLIALIKLGLSSKEIASLSNISAKSVEMNRYRLRKKLNLPPNLELSVFVNQI